MASMERMSSFRHEGHIFFIYDHKFKTEEDDPKDAILYFYPSIVGTDDQVALVGGIIGLADFCLEFLPQAIPRIVKLSFRNFALLQHEDFIIGLGGSPDIPDTFLTAHMQFVWSTFVMYQGSLSALRKRVTADNFIKELKNVWDYYLPLRQIQEDFLSQAFQVLPYVQLHKSQGNLFLHASHIIQRSLAYKGVMAGAIFNKNKVLCTQLSNSLTRQLLLLMSHSQFPCVEVNSVLELPEGVRLLHVYVPKNECAGLGYRRKKAYNCPKTVTEKQGQASSHQISSHTELSQSTPDCISTENLIQNGIISSGSEMLSNDRSIIHNGDEVSSDNRSSVGRETSCSTVSPTGRPTSGTDSEIFLDTVSDITFDTQNELKLTDIKHVECATSSTKLPPINLLPYSDASYSDPGYTQSQNDSLPPGATHKEHMNVASEPQNKSHQREGNEAFSDLSLEATNPSKYITNETPNEIQNKSSNNFNEQLNNLNNNENSEDNIGSTVLHFSENKKNNKNERSSSCDQVFVEMFESSTLNLEADGQVMEKHDAKISGKHFLTVDVLDNQSGSFTHSYSDSVDSIVTSTESSQINNSASSDQQWNKGYPKLKYYPEIGGSIPVSQEGPEPNLEIKNRMCQDSLLEPDFDMKNCIPVCQDSGLEPDSEIKESVPSCQDRGLEPDSEIKESVPSCHDRGLEPDSEIKESVPSCQDRGLEPDSEIKNRIPMNKKLDCQNDTYAASDMSLKQILDQSVNIENPDTKTAFENLHSGTLNSSSSDLTNEISALHGTAVSSNLPKPSAFNVAEMLAQNKEQIDSSLEVQASGDESSTQSSSELKQFDLKTSNLSLSYSDACATKDRLTFESIDSDYSEGGLLSPILFQPSVVTESSDNLIDDTCPSRSGSGESARKTLNNSRRIKLAVDGLTRSTSGRRDVHISMSDWNPQRDDLEEMTLYAQGHSDTLLLLLVSRSIKCSKVYISSLWKSCLSHLAELDFHVKDAERHVKDDTENIGANYQYMKYDSFTQNLKGSALLPVTSLANEIVDSSIRMHESFIAMPDLKEMTYRSHSACCYGQRSVNTETYFQLGLSRTSAGVCPPNDKTFCLDQMAEKFLQNDK